MHQETSFSSISSAALLEFLATSADKGLSESVAAERYRSVKKNMHTTSSRKMILQLLARQFINPLVLLLVIATLLSTFVGSPSDTFIILSILLISGLFGFWQELSAGRAVEKLRALVCLKASVLRGGVEREVDANTVIPGDIVILNAGDIIPADCRLLDDNELHVNESTITGESFPVAKKPGMVPDDAVLSDKTNCLWQGTSVISGTAVAVAVKTGGDTIFGQMTHSLEKKQETSFSRDIKHFGYFLMQITIVLCIVILAVNIYFKKPLFEAILFALAIAVGMAPELLPAIMTFAMAGGAKRMLAKKVIVSRLSAVFNLGEVDVLCTDKTGTITEGRIKVHAAVDVKGNISRQAELYGYLNASMQNGYSNPVDDALKELNVASGDYERCSEVPYDFIRKRLSILVKNGPKQIVITKGAVEEVMSVCTTMLYEGNITAIDTAMLLKYYEAQCMLGFRMLGLCYKETAKESITAADEQNMVFLGFILLEDPVKKDVRQVLEQLRQLGIAVKIITGDNEHIAAYVARNVGIDIPVVLTGRQIRHMLPEALAVQVLHTDVFASVEPHQKELIIAALQKSGLVVAYMGDGINDVAAIHAADTGISTDNATDVARQAADFILLEKSLSVLADGITEGRKTFANIIKYIFITTSATFGNMFSVAGTSLLLPFLPMLPKQILLTNFFTDLPFITISSDNVDRGQILKPGKWNMRLVRNFMIVFGLHSSVFDFLTFYILYFRLHLPVNMFRTGWFIESVLTELFALYIMRTAQPFFKSRPGRWLVTTSIFTAVVILLLPLSPFAAGLGFTAPAGSVVLTLCGILTCYVITADILKQYFFKWHEQKPK